MKRLSMGESNLLPGVSALRLIPPEIPADFMLRESLIERLDRPAPRNSFLIAPGGFGKTVLAAQFAAQVKEPLFWYTIKTGDTAYESLAYVVQGLRNIYTSFAPWFETLDVNAIDYKAAGTQLANEIAEREEPLTLILDGSDKFSPEFAPVVMAFAHISPRNLRTLSLRNVMPADTFIRAAKLDALSFITASDLRFNEVEISALAAKAGLDLSDPGLMERFRGIQGWPAGVLLTIDRLDNRRKNKMITPIENILISTSIEGLPQQDREYLESLIFLDDITFNLAQEFNPFPISSAGDHPLIRLSQNGVFLEEGTDGHFAMNSLIRAELLRQISMDTEKLRAQALRAVEIFEALGNPIRAVEILAQLGDRDLARKGHTYIAKIINRGESQLLATIAPQVAQNINLGGSTELNQILLDAYIAQITGENQSVLTFCKVIENHYPNIADTSGYRVEILGLRARAHFNLGAFTQVIAITEEMLDSPLLKEGYGSLRIRITNILRLAAAASFLREDYLATKRFAALIELPGDDVVNSVIIPAVQSEIALADGRYKHALEFAQASITASDRTGILGVYGAFDAAYVMADYYRESCDELRSIEIIDDYLARAKKHGVWAWYAAFMGKKAVVKAQLGQLNESLTLLRITREELSDDIFDPEILRIVDESELIIRERLVDPERVNELLFRMPKTFTTENLRLTQAVQKNPSQAPELLKNYENETPRRALMKELLFALALKDYPQEALKHLSVAASIASKNGARATFVAQSPEVQNLLLTLAEREPTLYLEKLASRIRAEQQGSMRSQMGLAEPLTKREVEILRRLASGLPITQIATTLHISHNTIKTHLKSVYRKLNVDSRSQALERAKELLLV